MSIPWGGFRGSRSCTERPRNRVQKLTARATRGHSLTYPVGVKNVTIALDDKILRDARRLAADRGTTLNAMIREYLERVTEQESYARRARYRIAELCRDARAEVGERR